MRLFIVMMFIGQVLTITSQSDYHSQLVYDFAESSEMKSGRFSFYAKNLNTDQILFDYDEDRRMSPASTLKLLTTYAAMDILGPEHRFTTKVGYTGTISPEGVLIGDIIIEAGGDPALGSENFLEEYGGSPIEVQVANSIRKAGIKKVEGRVIVDESIYSGIDIPDEWTWQDMGNYYATGAHALTFRENMFKVYFKSGSSAGSPALISGMDTELPDVEIINEVKAAEIRSDQAFFYTSPYSNTVRMFGRIPLNKKGFEVKGAMPDPSSVFKAEFISALRKMGISFTETVIESPDEVVWERDVEELIRFDSPQLDQLVGYTNMKSNNLYAEHFLRQIGKKRKGIGSFNMGISAIKEWCSSKGISTAGLRIKDGSGLSRANSVSANFFVDLLTHLSDEDYFESFKSRLPIAGRSGSMRRIGKGSALEGNMYAKTGYIEDARAYCGFLEKEDELIVFSIMANDYNLSASQMRVKMAEFMEFLGQ